MKFSRYVRVAILTDNGNFKVNVTPNNSIEITGGYEAPFLRLLLEALDLLAVIRIAKENEWGRQKKDGNWTGVIGMVSRDEADIAIGALLMTEERMKAVDFTYPYSIQDVTFATKIPGIVTTTKALTMPFSLDLWMGALVTLIILSVILRFLLSKKPSLDKIGFSLLGYALNQSSNMISPTFRDRVLLGSWIFSTVFLSKIYSTFLLSFLTLPIRENGIKDINELSKAVMTGTYKCYTTRGSSLLTSLSGSRQEAVKIIATAIQKNDWVLNTQKEFIEYLHKDNCAIIRTRQYIYNMLQDDIVVSDDFFYTAYSSIALKKNSPLKFKLNFLIHRVVESGLYIKYLDRYIFQERLSQHSRRTSENNFDEKLKIENFSGAFLLLTFGYSLALLVYILEIIHWRLSNRKNFKKSRG